MTRRWTKLVLAVGFLCLTGAAGVAHTSPATQYELSIYAATPLAVWVLLGGAYLVSLGALTAGTRRVRTLGLTLGTASTMLLVGLFLVRDYRYLGAGDALTHLGWTKAMATGALDPIELLYPATHVLGVILHAVVGGSFERNLLVVTVLFALAYVLGTAVLVRRMTDSRWGLAMGVVSAWLFLPIINVASYMMPFPTTQAIFFAPFVFFALVFFFQRGTQSTLHEGTTASGVLLLVLGSALILVHPQQAVNVVLVMVAIVGVQTLYRRHYPDHPVSRHQYSLIPAGILFGLLMLWLPFHPRSESAASGVYSGIAEALFGQADAAATISQRGGSLTDLGAGLPVVVLKILGVSLVFLALSVVAVLSFWYFQSETHELESFVLYLAAGAVPLAVLFGLYFLSTPTIAFRQLAFVFIVVTILGAIELTHLFESLRERLSAPTVRAVAVVVLAVFLVFSALTVFPSPYIFKPNGHVTTQQMAGHQSAFEYQDGSREFVSIRTGPGRYAHGIYGVSDPVALDTAYSGTGIGEPTFEAGNYTETYTDPRYFIVTRSDYEREVTLYDGFRYSKEGFEQLSRTPGVNKVLANGGLDLYTVGTAE